MPTTNIQIRVDKGLKAEAEQLFSDMGLDIPTAVRIFLKQSLNNNGLPFPVQRDPFYSAKNQEHLGRVATDLDQGHNCEVHELIEE